ncbi:MAG: hypothetical protein C0485_08220 [Pirellula sp.]|nr:hypothetical protein [Pirellula sp.]
MKKQVIVRVCAFAAVVTTIVGITTAASLKAINLGIVESITHDQTKSYIISPFFSSPFARNESLVGPMGVTYGPAGVTPPTQSSHANWEELVTHFVGSWSFTSTSKTNPADVEQYGFTILPFQYDGLTPMLPAISPLNHSFVSSPFTVTWDPPSNNYGYGAAGIINVVGQLIEPGKLEISFGKTINSSSHLSFVQSSPTQSLNEYISDTHGPTSGAEYDLMPTTYFARQANLRFYPVAVPEPSGLVLAILVGLVLRSGRKVRPTTPPSPALSP